MAHSYQVLTNSSEWEAIKPVCESLGRAMPKEGSGVVFAEFDEAGNITGFLTLQDAVFMEMVWARDGNTNIRTMWNMALRFLRERCPNAPRRELVTMADDTPLGAKIGKVLETLGCNVLPWKLYRRSF